MVHGFYRWQFINTAAAADPGNPTVKSLPVNHGLKACTTGINFLTLTAGVEGDERTVILVDTPPLSDPEKHSPEIEKKIAEEVVHT